MQTFNLIFRPEPEGGYTILVPALPGCITWAPSIEEGKVLIKDAINAYNDSIKKGLKTPLDDCSTKLDW